MRITTIAILILTLLLISCGSDEEAPLQPLGVVVTINSPTTTTFTAGDYIDYNATITNAGRNATFEITIETIMQDKNTGKVLTRRTDKTTFDTIKTLERSMQIPETASGTIELRERVTFDNSTEEAFFAIDVKELPTPEPAPAQEPSIPASGKPTAQPSEETPQEPPKPKSTKPQPNGQIRDITIDNYTFFPQYINITPGTTIRWTNIMRNSQNVAGPGFESEPLGTGKIFTHTFYKEQMISYGSSLSQAWGEIRVINTTAKKYDALEEFFNEGK